MALAHFALAALLSSSDATLATTLTANQLQQPQGGTAVFQLAAATPQSKVAQAPAKAPVTKPPKKTGKTAKPKNCDRVSSKC
jgi:hypothetical protein